MTILRDHSVVQLARLGARLVLLIPFMVTLMVHMGKNLSHGVSWGDRRHRQGLTLSGERVLGTLLGFGLSHKSLHLSRLHVDFITCRVPRLLVLFLAQNTVRQESLLVEAVIKSVLR